MYFLNMIWYFWYSVRTIYEEPYINSFLKKKYNFDQRTDKSNDKFQISNVYKYPKKIYEQKYFENYKWW